MDKGKDLVNVVRCNDCKHFVFIVFNKESGEHICANRNGIRMPKKTDFCSYGEKREDY